jgi:steroid 5-alpha reductase family enzyme
MTAVLASLALCLLGLCLVMSAAWAWQRRARNIGWVDVFWTFGTAAAGVALALVWSGAPGGSWARRVIVFAIAGVWAMRLGLHVALRVARSPEDGRYRALREDWGERLQPRLFGFLQVQALISTALAAAIALAADRPAPRLDIGDLAGVLIAVVAIGGEALADRQMEAFRRDPANRGRVCDTGLWGWSRHPNYVFEWLGWFAYPAMAVDLTGAWPQGGWALLAPALMFAVLRLGTGVPPLEAHMLRTRGAAFQAYQARVPAFIPRPPRSQPRVRP